MQSNDEQIFSVGHFHRAKAWQSDIKKFPIAYNLSMQQTKINKFKSGFVELVGWLPASSSPAIKKLSQMHCERCWINEWATLSV